MLFNLEKLVEAPPTFLRKFNTLVEAVTYVLKLKEGRGILIRRDSTGLMIEADIGAIAAGVAAYNSSLADSTGDNGTSGASGSNGAPGGGGGSGGTGLGNDPDNGISEDSNGNPIDEETGLPLGIQTLVVCIELEGGEKVLRKMKVYGTAPYEF